MSLLEFYDGSRDIKASETLHTVALTSCGIVAYSKNDSMTLRQNGRSDWSLFYCERGKMDFQGQTLHVGEAFIYPPFVRQSYRTDHRDRTRYAYLHFGGSCLHELFSALSLAFCAPISVRSKNVFELFAKIAELCFSSDVRTQVRAESLILELLFELAEPCEKGNPEEKREAHIMRAITEKMAHCFAEEYDVALYASMLNVSIDRFQHLFKEHIGLSPYAYYLSLRMENAARLLADTDMKIKTVAEYCGYRDPLYFTQAFRKYFGRTPREYRNAECKTQNKY